MITAHTIVKNEERFIWYSVMSVVDYVDEYLIWDMGSKDRTIKILENLAVDPRTKGKIKFKKLESDSHFDERKIREDMLSITKSGWFIVVDGDEIWWQKSIRDLTNLIRKSVNNLESIVVPTVNLVGDMYHYQDKSAGHYHLAGKTGHYNLRAVSTSIPGLSSNKPHGTWGWTDGDGRMIQDRNQEKIQFLDAPYLHATHLQRSGNMGLDREVFKRAFKYKHELGNLFPFDYFYPESFFLDKPEDIIPNIWKPMSFSFWLRSLMETPFRKLKRKIIPAREGY